MSDCSGVKQYERYITTSQQARDYFASSGLTYADLTRDRIMLLMAFLEKHLSLADIESRLSVCERQKITLNKGAIEQAYLTVTSPLWESGRKKYYREAISFNRDGFIGFCGWADSKTQQPMLDAFVEWIGYLKEEK